MSPQHQGVSGTPFNLERLDCVEPAAECFEDSEHTDAVPHWKLEFGQVYLLLDDLDAEGGPRCSEGEV